MNEQVVFLDIDTQVDFMLPRGALYVPGAETTVPNLRRLMEHAVARNLTVLSSADAHSIDDPSFSEWPPHCIVGTPGQRRIPETQLAAAIVIPNQQDFFKPPLPAGRQVIIEKTDYDVSSNPNFDAILAALRPSRFAAFGVATEYCVRTSVLMLRRRGLAVELVSDAVKGITEEGHQRALRELAAAGVHMVTTVSVLASIGGNASTANPE